jgi:sugar lactone lactonase YvrE
MQIIPKSALECIYLNRALLGESPVWNEEENCLYWVDIEGQTFNRFDPTTSKNIAINTEIRVSAIAQRELGGCIVATEVGFQFYNPTENKFTPIVDPEKNKPNNRFNDGRCDRAGRFWAGTMIEKGDQIPDAALYCIDKNLACTKKNKNLILANGLAWSPNNQTMYLADTRHPIVWAFDFDMDNGDIFNQRPFIEFGVKDGVPDGATIDTDGCYWLAQPRASQICRYTPDGRKDTVIELPVSKPTMCAFGGSNLNVLYITTNSFGFSEEELKEQPLAGSLLGLELNAQGLPEPKFIG